MVFLMDTHSVLCEVQSEYFIKLYIFSLQRIYYFTCWIKNSIILYTHLCFKTSLCKGDNELWIGYEVVEDAFLNPCHIQRNKWMLQCASQSAAKHAFTFFTDAKLEQKWKHTPHFWTWSSQDYQHEQERLCDPLSV